MPVALLYVPSVGVPPCEELSMLFVHGREFTNQIRPYQHELLAVNTLLVPAGDVHEWVVDDLRRSTARLAIESHATEGLILQQFPKERNCRFKHLLVSAEDLRGEPVASIKKRSRNAVILFNPPGNEAI